MRNSVTLIAALVPWLALTSPPAVAQDAAASGGGGTAEHSIHRLGTLLQLDTRLKHGTSGGPVFDLDGQLLALTTSTAPHDGIETAAGIEAGDFIELIADQTAETPAEFYREVNSRRGSVSLKLLDGRRVTLEP